MIRTKDAKLLRFGIENAKADIRTWGDNQGSKTFLDKLSTMEDKLAKYPVLVGRGYRTTIEKFYKKGGNISMTESTNENEAIGASATVLEAKLAQIVFSEDEDDARFGLSGDQVFIGVIVETDRGWKRTDKYKLVISE